jgi:ribose transport system substrate-binding protein
MDAGRSRSARGVVALGIGCLIAIAVAACGQSAGAQRPAHFALRKPLKIGYSVYDLSDPYWQSYAEGIQAEAKALHMGFAESDQKSSELAQVTSSADLIDQGISALIVSPVQPAALTATEDSAHANRIPVIVGDVGAVGNYDVFVQSANRGGGALAARYMVSRLAKRPGVKEIGVINLAPGNVSGELRVGGFTSEIAKQPGFKIVANLNGNEDVLDSFTVAEDMLIAHPHLAGIFAANDSEAEGAVQALAQAGKNGNNDVVVVGFNGDAPALSLIKSGQMAATVAQDPYGEGQAAVRAAYALIHNQPVKYSQRSARTIDFPIKLVTRATLEKQKGS